MNDYVFISYVRDDTESVNKIVSALRNAGINVWLDRDSIQPGSNWRYEIQQGILHGMKFIAVFSKNFHNRRRSIMSEELTLATSVIRQSPPNTDKWFIPVVLDKSRLPFWELRPGENMQDIQYTDFSDDWEWAMDSLLATIKSDALSKPRLDELITYIDGSENQREFAIEQLTLSQSKYVARRMKDGITTHFDRHRYNIYLANEDDTDVIDQTTLSLFKSYGSFDRQSLLNYISTERGNPKKAIEVGITDSRPETVDYTARMIFTCGSCSKDVMRKMDDLVPLIGDRSKLRLVLCLSEIKAVIDPNLKNLTLLIGRCGLRRVTISWHGGLDWKEAQKLRRTADKYRSTSLIAKISGDQIRFADALNTGELLDLRATSSSKIIIACFGADSAVAVEALANVVNANFGMRY